MLGRGWIRGYKDVCTALRSRPSTWSFAQNLHLYPVFEISGSDLSNISLSNISTLSSRAESSGSLLKERRDEVRMCRLSVFSANCIAGTAGLHFRRCISSGAGGNDNRPGLCAIDRAVVLGEFTLRKGFKLIFDPGFRVYDLFWWL